MGARDRILPPGPNPREDQIAEKHQKQLRRFMNDQTRASGAPGRPVPPDESESANQAEGEREGGPGKKVKGTPGQAEGERRQVEEEIETEEKTKH